MTPLHLDLTYYPGLESVTALKDKLSALDFPAAPPVSTGSMSDYAVQRERMVRELIAARGVRDERVLAALRKTPRHLFVKDHLRSQAYGDHALPIGSAQTISQPYIVARMSELLEVGPEHSVLEIGTGSGYQTAVLALLARRVYSLERVPELAQAAIPRMRQLGFDNVKIQVFDGTVGWSEWAPVRPHPGHRRRAEGARSPCSGSSRWAAPC